jgi:hypothetical protein
VKTTTHITARIPTALSDALARLAEQEDRTVSAEVKRAVREYVARNDDEPPRSGSIAKTPANQEPVCAKD